MQSYIHGWVKNARKSLFTKNGPLFSKKLPASIACMLATFSMSGSHNLDFQVHIVTSGIIFSCDEQLKK